ncbi:sensor histidine kinase [Azospirillum halopraeferens]|uniref:sensor histidine kinase n=1 Tax=Azospirillum halopraeferens TaxID=34010 RepID=UPI000685150C|nr:sensor histidine kinase [Azospirillum halopraeferens]
MAEVGVTHGPDAPLHHLRSGEDGGAKPGPGARLSRLWHQRSMRAQILATFVLINVVACITASVLVVYNARRAALIEIDASIEMAERFVRATIERLEKANPGGVRPDELPLHISHQRHVRILITAADGQPIWLADDAAAVPEEDAAPRWFADLVGAGVEDLARTVPVRSAGRTIATVTVAGEAADEIAEVWQDMSDLGLLALLVNLAVIAVLHVALGRLLHPLGGLAAGFRELEQGRFRHRLERPETRELADLVDRFNALARSLAGARADNARLSRRLVAVQDDERRRIAAELHDELGPCLFGLKANVASLSRLAGKLPDEIGGPLRERADTLMEIGERIQTANRRLLTTVRPMALGHVPLAEALVGLIAEFERHAPDCAFRFDGGAIAASYGDSVDLTIYRCIQEGVTNAVRHAGARRIAVTVRQTGTPETEGPGAVRLTVEDDGRGPPPDGAAGLGLTAMRERVLALGGTVSLTARPDGGTRLLVRIPLHDADRTPPMPPVSEEPKP